MPEGHVLHRAARRINAAMKGARIDRIVARGPDLTVAKTAERLEGATLTEAEARGKWLLLHFDNGYSVLNHLRMDGAWHLYRTGEPWRKSPRRAWLALEAGDWQAVEYDGPIMELHHTDELLRDERLTTLGPDILAEPFDDAEFIRRMRTRNGFEIGHALMQQRLVSGIGNIYKNETCFMCGVDPWRTVASLDDAALVRMREVASRIMLDGVLDMRAVTFHGPGPVGNWVYGRTGQGCRSCATELKVRYQGDDQRITWWCPSCQT